MVPPRKSTNQPRKPNQKQSSISDFFAARPARSAQTNPKTATNVPFGPIRRPTRKLSRKLSCKKSSDTIKAEHSRISPSSSLPPESLLPPTKHLASSDDETSQSQLLRFHRMEVEKPTAPLTTEELMVQEGIRSLECSQDVPEDGTTSDGAHPSNASDSSCEDSDEELAKLERIKATRRSARNINPVKRFDPSQLPQTSVFGPVSPDFNGRGDAIRNPESYMAKLLRERNARDKREDHLQQMRNNLQRPPELKADEKIFADMARSEEKVEKKRRASLEKYSTPIPLFSNPIAIVDMPQQYLVRGPLTKIQGERHASLHTTHDMLLDVIEAGEHGDHALSILLPILAENIYYPDVKQHPVVFRMVFILAIFDKILPEPGRKSRDELVDTLIRMVENDVECFKELRMKIPTFMNTLRKYGATMPDWSKPELIMGTQSPQKQCLDHQIPTADNTNVGNDFKTALRNLKRASKLAAAFVRLGIPLHQVIGVPKRPLEEQVLCSLGLVMRVLLSAFGNRLYVEIGELMTQLLNLIPTKHWAQFRLKAAEYMLSFSTRLELHVELVAHLIPHRAERPRYLALDYAFLSFAQWCGGPGNEPMPQLVHNYEVSERAKRSGIKIRCYCLADVVELLQKVPEIDKDTDCVWAWLISCQLRLILSEPSVFQKLGAGELSRLNQQVQKMRTCTNRMAFDVPVQDMRMELDTLVKTYRAFGGTSRAGMAEVLPNVRVEKKQRTLSSML